MENTVVPQFNVSDFIALTNQVLEYAYPRVEVIGEVSGFKINQRKYVFFDLKDANGTINCFMMYTQLRAPIEDGMKVIVTASPKLTQWGKFSLTVRAVQPSGEGSLKKSFELLRAKLDREGLFALERKRSLPLLPETIAVISSTQAAGYADFIKILNDRWGGLHVQVAHVQVQGSVAPDQMIEALRYFNSLEILPEVIVIIRGGGSADDLSAFNDELLVREIAASRVPTLVGVGHEDDVSLADMVADVRAATPSNAAQIIVPDREELIRGVRRQLGSILPRTEQAIERRRRDIQASLYGLIDAMDDRIEDFDEHLKNNNRLLAELNPRKVLSRGYALVRGEIRPGGMIEIEKSDTLIRAEVQYVNKK